MTEDEIELLTRAVCFLKGAREKELADGIDAIIIGAMERAQAVEPDGYLDHDYAASLERNGSATIWSDESRAKAPAVAVFIDPSARLTV